MTALVGWFSSIVLLATLVVQVRKQWTTQSIEGVSPWLYIGQVCASTGFAIYSWLVHSWVFAVTNVLGLASAITGLVIFYRNKKRSAEATG